MYLFAMKYIAILLLLCTISLPSLCQQFGAFPPSTKWRQLNSDTVRVIYAPAAEQQARRIMALVHRVAADTVRNIGNRLRKVNIVLHDRTTLANGYVALGPFRSEFYLIPGSNVFDFGNLPWHENLAIHEYRHVHQYNNFRHGISKALSYVFGENGQAFGNAITIPDWFFEGDAVYAETALTTQGRGRLPYFQSGYKSLWLENRKYSWQKLRNGSLKDYVPNPYQLGYLLANYGYLKYGDTFWPKVTRDASAFKGLFYPFQKAIREHAGISYKTFRKEALEFYKNQLPPSSNHQIITSSHPPDSLAKRKTVTHYYFPQYIGQDSLIYLKSAYNKIPAFYLKDKSGEQKISLRSISSEEWFGYRNGKIVYTAYSTHPRWTLIDFSDIVLLDLSTRSEKRLTRGQRFYTPDISPSGNKIVAIRMNEALETELQLIDVYSGATTKTVKHKSYFLSNPRFVDENRVVVGTRLPDATMALQILDLISNEWQPLTPFSSNHASLPYVDGNNIYFVSNAGGNDDIYRISLKDKSIDQLTFDATGNYYPSVFRDTLTWSHFTSNG
ncbi:MAG: TolB family protein, partial [Flavisolibacter sp.]